HHFPARRSSDQSASVWPSSPHNNWEAELERNSAARCRKDRLFTRVDEVAAAPAAIRSASAVFPEPRAPMIQTKPGFSETGPVAIHGALVTLRCRIVWEGTVSSGGKSPT